MNVLLLSRHGSYTLTDESILRVVELVVGWCLLIKQYMNYQ
jgi:hypothetical protein